MFDNSDGHSYIPTLTASQKFIARETYISKVDTFGGQCVKDLIKESEICENCYNNIQSL